MAGDPVRHPRQLLDEWRPVVGLEGELEVSRTGSVRRPLHWKSKRQRPKPELRRSISKGYVYVAVYDFKFRRTKRRLVHVMVAEAFIGPRPGGLEVNHRNGRKADCNADNLEYLTRSANVRHALRMGLTKPPTGGGHWNSKLSESDVQTVLSMLELGEIQRVIAKQLNISQATVSNLATGTTWRDRAVTTDLRRRTSPRAGAGTKLSDDDVRAIRRLAPSCTQQELASRFGVVQSTISRIISGRRRPA